MDLSKLSAPFPPEVVSWRVGSTTGDKKRGMALAYVDARDVQDRLNEVCGPFGWQCRHEVSHDKRITCHIGIRSPEGEWCWKSDGAGETDYEAEKGSYSDSFKRAAVKWGVARYLYDLGNPWVAIEQAGKSYKIAESEMPRLRAMLGGAKASAAPSLATDPKPLSAKAREYAGEIMGCMDEGELKAFGAKRAQDIGKLSPEEQEHLRLAYNTRKASVSEKEAA